METSPAMKFTAAQIAGMLGGAVEGDPDATVTRLSKIEEGTPGSLSFLSNPLYARYLYTTEASVVIVNRDFNPEQPVKATLVRVESADQAFARLLEIYNRIKNERTGISALSSVSGTARIGDRVYIGDFAVIGDQAVVGNNVQIHPQVFIGDNCVVGDNTILYPGVRLYSETVIGRNCMLHAGTVVGSDGFRFHQVDGQNRKVPQIGNVVIEDDVETGSNCCIDRATLGSTILRRGVKLDNLVHVAHNVEIGENTVIAASTGIAGSTKLGKNCMISGHVAFTGHITVADGTVLGGATGVSKSLTKPGQTYLGSPAMEVSKFRRVIAIFRNLPELAERVGKLEKAGKDPQP